MRTTQVLTGALLAATALLTATPVALAQPPAPSPSDSTSGNGSGNGDGEEAAPTEAGTGFRTATKIRQDQRATADASTGDYLYWVFSAEAGKSATVRATVKLPDPAARHGAVNWRLDVYDGLRRRQDCAYGSNSRSAPKEAESVELTCHLRTVRAWAEPWANDPLPGSYYLRLTVGELPQEDLGLPVRAEVEATTVDAGGSRAVDGALSVPLVPGASDEKVAEAAGSASDRWSSRWLWTVGGGVLGAIAALAGYSLTRGSGRPSRVPRAV
ncbi:hypothetical protein [Streptomyces sp. H27-C3]|uniref:hypothetical protein n=1 Tax=Streptomyces sp. H27-C3 TaxID=3046305 RepID=UPI0024B89298|nr:hypothetical protein [Streptomyces sp. H27-C3]MDJ0462713.1 hypothetical protein [Streptomyces sp. H27-C3]